MLITLVTVILIFSTVSCSNFTQGGSAKGSSDISISDPVFGFISEDEYDPATTVIDTNKKWTSLDVDISYYLFVSFDIISAKNNDGQSLLDLNITFDSLDVMDGTIEDVSTGMLESMVFTDATTGNLAKTTTASFKIPALSTEPKTIEMIVKLKPVNIGESHILLGFEYDESGDYKILGSDGYTKNLTIKEIQIDTPVVTVTDLGLLSWTNVKNADYYMFYENGEELTDVFGEVIVLSAEGYSVGGTIEYNIGKSISEFHNISVRAYSNNQNILPSNYSESVSYTW